MLVAVERDFLQHAPLHGTRAAAEVVETLAAPCDQPVKSITAHQLEAAADTRPTAPDRQVRLIQRFHQLADLGTLDLVIGGRGYDHTAGRTLKSRHECGGLAKALGEADNDEIVAARQQPLQRGGNFRPWPVQHDDELVRNVQSVEAHPVLGIQRSYVAGMAIADRHDHRQRQDRVFRSSTRHEWAH